MVFEKYWSVCRGSAAGFLSKRQPLFFSFKRLDRLKICIQDRLSQISVHIRLNLMHLLHAVSHLFILITSVFQNMFLEYIIL